MYALVEILGKQYKAEKGKTIKVDKIGKNHGDKIEFDTILLLSDNGKVDVGAPYLPGARVKATVGEQVKGKKVVIYKYKKRKSYRRKRGFRGQYTNITVDEIIAAGK
jgi:large subunit ribosomal protein L21